jgi:hypothetical protein
MISTFKAILLKKQVGIYTKYVFQNWESGEYVMLTQPPNWDLPTLEEGAIGFVTMESVIAGEKYFNRNTNKEDIYRYTQDYLKDFMREKEQFKAIIL